MNVFDIGSVLHEISFPGYHFEVNHDQGGLYLQAVHHGAFVTSDTEWKTRKWKLSEHMTKSELVQTALKCILTSIEHEARESFRYRGELIFGPHFDVDELVTLCRKPNHKDAR